MFPVYFYHSCTKTFLNAFYNVLLELVWFWLFRSCSRSVPGLSPAGCVIGPLFGSGSPDHAGWRGFYGVSGGGLFLIGWRFPGWYENAKKMYDKLETESKPTRLELEKSEKNRRNLRLIQTCDFFIFVHFVYNFL